MFGVVGSVYGTVREMKACAECNAACCREPWDVDCGGSVGVPPELTEPGVWGSPKMRRHPRVACCIALDPETNRCTIYDVRPNVCRNFEVGSEECLDLRADSSRNRMDCLTFDWSA